MPGQMGLIGMLGLGGMEAQDLAPMMALSGASGATGGSGGTGGGFDPTMLMLLSQTGGGLGGGLGEMLPLLMLSQSMNQRQQPMAAPALNPMAAQLLKMLGSTGTSEYHSLSVLGSTQIYFERYTWAMLCQKHG